MNKLNLPHTTGVYISPTDLFKAKVTVYYFYFGIKPLMLAQTPNLFTRIKRFLQNFYISKVS